MRVFTGSRRFIVVSLWLGLLAAVFQATGCKKNLAEQATESDANGYLCAKCNAKFYTKRSVFPSACPQCRDADIIEVVGYYCERCKHLTILKRPGRGNERIACEKCSAPLSGMRLPREKNLQDWGATKVSH